MTSAIRVAIAGPRGRMGQEAVLAVAGVNDMQLVACLDRHVQEEVIRPISVAGQEIPVFYSPSACFAETHPDVLVDFTNAHAAPSLIDEAVAQGVRPVIGTTGFPEDFLQHLDRSLKSRELGGLYAPNFAIGALLMMRASEIAARFLSDVTIVEYHHASKRDAPSGTAKKTAERIERTFLERGVDATSPLIHSVRLPGFIAHQEVIFGGLDERLTIRHDSMSRKSFMPGVLLGIREVMRVTGLVDGLEHFLW